MVKLDLKAIYEWPLLLQILALLPCCLVLFYFAYMYDYVSLTQKMHASQKQEVELKDQLKVVLLQQMQLQDQIRRLPILEKLIAEWHRKLIPAADIPQFLNELLKIGGANSLKFNQMQPGVDEKADIYTKVPIKINAEGRYIDIASFISQVANLKTLVVVQNITLDKKPLASAGDAKNVLEQVALRNILTAEMVLDVYYFPGNEINDKK